MLLPDWLLLLVVVSKPSKALHTLHNFHLSQTKDRHRDLASWQFLWSCLLISGPVSYSEGGSKTAVVTILWPKIAYDTEWSLHSVFVGMIHIYWPTNKNVTWNQIKHKTAYLKLLCLSLSPLLLFSAHIKTTTGKVWSIMLFCLPLAYTDDVLLFCSNMRRIVRVNRCHHCTVYTHVIAMFIRAMLHSVTCNDLIGLLKSCSVSGFRCVKLSLWRAIALLSLNSTLNAPDPPIKYFRFI